MRCRERERLYGDFDVQFCLTPLENLVEHKWHQVDWDTMQFIYPEIMAFVEANMHGVRTGEVLDYPLPREKDRPNNPINQ